MKTNGLILFAVVLLLLTSCKDVTEKQVNNEDFVTIKEMINKSDTLTASKKRYIIDNLTALLGFVKLGETIKPNFKDSLPTFKEQIIHLNDDYNKISNEIKSNIENNKKLRGLLTLKGAEALSIDKYKGYLKMTFTCNNSFDKEILYALIQYKYVDKYDSKYFDEKVKLTDKAANNFKSGDMDVMTNEQYNQVTDFMYTKVPQSRNKEFMMEGLKVDILGVVFTDKTELQIGNESWEYLD